ncbi:pyridoxal phosphate-dependent aminotransferase [Negadavirga shengliensis]|uniref:Pyridoxal phosphate-dependent aminotransferase n=1 Tax=Negadavirga shengliensis TaxID=1389218 RepID=A0ABV9T281_9BACT
MKLNRRQWLKRSALAGSVGLFSGLPGFQALSKQEIEAFRPRPLYTPIRLGSNENPYGPSARVREAIKASFDDGCRYPWSYEGELLEMIAKKEGLTKECIVITGGSTEGLKVAGIACAKEKKEIIAAKPTFDAMMQYAQLWGTHVNWVPLDQEMMYDLNEIENRVSSNTKMVFLCNPNNPTSTLLPAPRVMDFCETVSRKTIVFSDEAYYDYIEDAGYPSMTHCIKKDLDVIVSRTFSKVYGLAGLRIGYLMARPELASQLRRHVVAFTNVLALKAAAAAMEDRDFYKFSLDQNHKARKSIYEGLDRLALEYLPSQTNFVFFKTEKDIRKLQAKMLEKGVIIGRPFEPLTDWCRISTGTMEEVELFVNSLHEVMGELKG